MKLKLAFVALVAFGGAALSAGAASAMPLAPLQSSASNVESVALVCGPRGCVRTVPAYRRGVVGSSPSLCPSLWLPSRLSPVLI